MSNNHQFTGVFIPASIYLDKSLSAIEKLFWSEVNALSQTQPCTASNAHFSEHLNLHERSIPRMIKNLIEKGYLFMQMIDGHIRNLFAIQPQNKSFKEINKGDDVHVTPPMTPMSPHVNISRNTNNNATEIQSQEKSAKASVVVALEKLGIDEKLQTALRKWCIDKSFDTERIQKAVDHMMNYSPKPANMYGALRSCIEDQWWISKQKEKSLHTPNQSLAQDNIEDLKNFCYGLQSKLSLSYSQFQIHENCLEMRIIGKTMLLPFTAENFRQTVLNIIKTEDR